MKRISMMTAAAAVVLAASAFLAQPVQAAPHEELLACTETQKAEVRAWISDTCGGSGWASVYCSWTGLWQINSYGCTDTASPLR